MAKTCREHWRSPTHAVRRLPSGTGTGSATLKKASGRKRHLVVDVYGCPLVAHVHPADVQDRDGAVSLLMHPEARQRDVHTVFADGGYGGPKLRKSRQKAGCSITVTVAKKPKDVKKFALLPRRWQVERIFGWLR